MQCLWVIPPNHKKMLALYCNHNHFYPDIKFVSTKILNLSGNKKFQKCLKFPEIYGLTLLVGVFKHIATLGSILDSQLS